MRRRFNGDDFEACHGAWSKRGDNGDVGGVAPPPHQDAADARAVVARVECIPAIAEIDLEPGGKIHWRRVWRHADVAEITSAIARRYIHAAAQCDRQMSEVTADAALLAVGSPCGFGRARMLVAEFDPIMDVIADRLHERPAFRNAPKQGPRFVRQAIGLAVPAAKQIDQNVHRQIFQRVLVGLRRSHVRLPAVSDQKVCRHC